MLDENGDTKRRDNINDLENFRRSSRSASLCSPRGPSSAPAQQAMTLEQKVSSQCNHIGDNDVESSVPPTWEAQACTLLTDFAYAVRDSDGPLSQQLQLPVLETGSWTRRPRSLFLLPPPGAELWRRCVAQRVQHAEVDTHRRPQRAP